MLEYLTVEERLTRLEKESTELKQQVSVQQYHIPPGEGSGHDSLELCLVSWR